MSTSNIVELEARRKEVELKKKESQFKVYLSSLKQDQLQTEANYLLNKVSNTDTADLNEEYLLKSALLMDELAKRVSADKMSHTINKFADNIREKMDNPSPPLQ